MIGDIVEISIPEGMYDYVVTKVFPGRLHISPRDHFGEEAGLIQVRGEWKVYKFEREHTVRILPIKIKRPEDYTSQIVLTGKDRQRSSSGGMTRDQLESSQLVCLIHITYDIESIIDSWKLDHRISVSKARIPVHRGLAGAYEAKERSIEISAYGQSQFPGIYTSVVSQLDFLDENYGNRRIRPGYVELILPLSLLEQRNWHMNVKDNFGSIDNTTFTPETLPTYLPKLQSFWGKIKHGPEFVFHDAISLDFVEAILVDNEITRKRIESMVEGKIPVLIRSKDLYKEFASRKFFRGEDRLSSLPPQYCYTGIHGQWTEEEGPISNHVIRFQAEDPYTQLEFYDQITREQRQEEDAYIWQKQLDLCGIPEVYIPERRDELFKMIEDRMQELYYEDAPRPPVRPEDYPPWKYTPEYYTEHFPIK